MPQSTFMHRARNTIAAALAVLSLGQGAAAQDQGQARLGELLLGNFVFILFHEIGHAFIHELGLPVVGVEEDVVDEFSAMTLTAFAGLEELPEEQRLAFNQIVLDAALGFSELWNLRVQQTGGDLTQIPYWDEHGLDVKRFYNILCVFAGSNPEEFGPIAMQFDMPEERVARCAEDYRAKDAAWEQLLTPYIRPDGQPIPDAQRVRVEYGAATTPFSQQLEADLRQRQLLESVAEMLEASFVLPRGLILRAGECNDANALYDPEEGSVTMCHELVAFLRDVFTGAAAAPAPQQQPVPQPMPQPVPQPMPQPVPQPMPMPPGGQAGDLVGFLAGAWDGSYADPMTGQPVQVNIVFLPDGSYTQIAMNMYTGFVLRIWGRIATLPGGAGIRTQVDGYDPTVWCGPTGYCSPIVIPMAETVPVQVVDPNTIYLGPAMMMRTG
jgi:hypothetical protein